jgi:CheY-like chemotaxis protein
MTHNSACLTILLIQNNPSVAGQIGVAPAAEDAGSFEVEWVRQLSQDLERLSKKGIAAILLDLSLPDSEGVETFDKLFATSPRNPGINAESATDGHVAHVPILSLARDGSEALAKEAVRRGAHDYLVAAHLDTYSLQRALRNAVERKGIEDALYVEKERAVVTLNSIGDAVLCTDIFGNITYLNIVAEKMTGWLRAEAIGNLSPKCFELLTEARARPHEIPWRWPSNKTRRWDSQSTARSSAATGMNPRLKIPPRPSTTGLAA